MRIIIRICDRCGATEEVQNDNDSKYATVIITLHLAGWPACNESRFYFCPECQKELGLVKETRQLSPIGYVGGQLYDLIAQIVQENSGQ